jgi:hypothetical protein
MHELGAVLATAVMAAEKSRTSFYVAGGLLAAWAVIVTLAFGLRRPKFPGSAAGARIVMAISAALVVATGVTAVMTESTPKEHPVASTGAGGAAAGGAASGGAASGGPASGSR